MIKFGKVIYRNIQEQVAKNTEDIAKIFRRPVLQVKMVDELPEEGEEGILYLLPATDPEIGNYYEEYLWIDSAWELIGSSSVDISNMVTTDTEQEITGEKTFAFSLKPTATSTYDLGSSSFKWSNIYLNSAIYIGPFSSTYINTDAYGGIALNINNSTKFLVREGTTYINNNFYPLSNGTRSIGTSGGAFKDLWLTGKIDLGTKVSGRTNTCKIELDNYDGVGIYSNNVRAINIYDNAIYVAKPFYVTNTIVMRSPNNSDNWKLIGNDNGSMTFGYGNNTYYAMNTAGIFPTGNETRVCGAPSLRWLSVYTKEIGNGTDSVSVADLAALITYAKAQGWIS